MKQAYLSNAVTNIHIRNEINSSKLKNYELAEKFKEYELIYITYLPKINGIKHYLFVWQ